MQNYKRILIKRTLILFGGWLVLLLLAGCGLPGLPAPTPTATTVPEDVVLTQAAQTIFAGMATDTPVLVITITPEPTRTSTSTPDLRPTQTPLLTNTPGVTDTPAPSQTSALTPTPTQTAGPSPTSSPTVVMEGAFEDDFEQSEGWAKVDENTHGMGYSGGSYFIRVHMLTEDAPVFSVRSFNFADLSVGVDVIRAEGPEDAFFGVVCRFQNSRNYYRFVVGKDGYYNIGKRLDGSFIDLGSGTKPDAFKTDAVNRIGATCMENTLTLSLNGVKLLEASDFSFTQGNIGLVVGTRNEDETVVYFDNYEVVIP